MFRSRRRITTLTLPALGHPFERNTWGIWTLQRPHLSATQLRHALRHISTLEQPWLIVDPMGRFHRNSPSCNDTLWIFHPPTPRAIGDTVLELSKRRSFSAVLLLDLERTGCLWGRQGPERPLWRPLRRAVRRGLGVVQLEVLTWQHCSVDTLVPRNNATQDVTWALLAGTNHPIGECAGTPSC